jgi:hypothetical protein
MNAMINVQHDLSVAPAYLTAIHTLAGGLMLTCCTKYRAMLPNNETVLKRIRRILGEGGHGDGQVSSRFSKKITKKIIIITRLMMSSEASYSAIDVRRDSDNLYSIATTH